MFEDFRWLNRPKIWQQDARGLSITTGDRTDFWQTTFYGFRRDDGHACLKAVEGDFTISASVRGAYSELYDQAGVMLRLDAQNWIKTGIEYTDGLMHFSVVVTRTISDWSVIPLPNASVDDIVNIRLTRHDDAVRVQYAIGDQPWRLARLAPFSAAPAQAGVMACSPQRAGFEAVFSRVEIGPAISRELHAE